MIQAEEKKKRQTDQAWNSLYNRLEQDGLLAHLSVVTRWHNLPPYRWAAAVLVMALLISTVWLVNANYGNEQELLTVQNGKETTTLVTTLEDGSIVYLANNTSLAYPEHFRKDRREVTLRGNALFDVSSNRQRPFLIETQQMKIEVVGTAFNVRSTASHPFELAVQRGEVKVTLKANGESKHVQAGETVTLHSRQLQVSATKDQEQFTHYTRRIQFKDARLGDILRVINRESSGTLLEASPALANRKLTVSFLNDTPDVMAELICLALKLNCTKQENRLLLTEP